MAHISEIIDNLELKIEKMFLKIKDLENIKAVLEQELIVSKNNFRINSLIQKI